MNGGQKKETAQRLHGLRDLAEQNAVEALRYKGGMVIAGSLLILSGIAVLILGLSFPQGTSEFIGIVLGVCIFAAGGICLLHTFVNFSQAPTYQLPISREQLQREINQFGLDEEVKPN